MGKRPRKVRQGAEPVAKRTRRATQPRNMQPAPSPALAQNDQLQHVDAIVTSTATSGGAGEMGTPMAPPVVNTAASQASAIARQPPGEPSLFVNACNNTRPSNTNTRASNINDSNSGININVPVVPSVIPRATDLLNTASGLANQSLHAETHVAQAPQVSTQGQFISIPAQSLAGLGPNQQTAAAFNSPLSPRSEHLGVAVPQNIKERIWKGEFVEFGVLLPGNSSSTASMAMGSNDQGESDLTFFQKGQQIVLRPATPKRNIWSIEKWTDAFLVFASIYVQAKPQLCQDLLKYCSIIRSAATSYVGLGWRDYDTEFRRRKQNASDKSWADIDGELWLMKVVGGGQLRSGLSVPGQRSPPWQRQQSGFKRGGLVNKPGGATYVNTSMTRPPSTARGQGLCWELNYKGACARPVCTFSHACSYCGIMGHGKVLCPRSNTTKSKGQSTQPVKHAMHGKSTGKV